MAIDWESVNRPGYFVNPGWESDCQGEKEMGWSKSGSQWEAEFVQQLPLKRPWESEMLDASDVYYCNQCDTAMSRKEYYAHHCATKNQRYHMTQQEAINKLDGIYPSGERVSIVNALAALGLLKFEKEGKIADVVENVIGFSVSQSLATPGHNDTTSIGKAVIEDLEKSGYKIIKVGQIGGFQFESNISGVPRTYTINDKFKGVKE